MFGLKLALPRWWTRKSALQVVPHTSAPVKAPTPGLSPIASAVVLAAGAGVAFWWWTQWARGRAESEGGGEGESAAGDGDNAKAEPAKRVD